MGVSLVIKDFEHTLFKQSTLFKAHEILRYFELWNHLFLFLGHPYNVFTRDWELGMEKYIQP